MHAENSSATHEKRDASVAVVLAIAGLTVLGVALTLLVAAVYYNRGYRAHALPEARQTPFTNGPTYRTSVVQEWPALEAETRKHLDNYAWIDRSNGVVQIPVERAMTLLAEEAAAAGKPTKPK